MLNNLIEFEKNKHPSLTIAIESIPFRVNLLNHGHTPNGFELFLRERKHSHRPTIND